MQPDEKTQILDLGSEDGSHIAALVPYWENVTLADIDEKLLDAGKQKYGFKTVLLDECGKLPFADNSFDIVYCNSVIEHVGPLKVSCWDVTDGKKFAELSFEHQKEFAKEIRRVGKSYFVQTPNKYYILESHTWLPIIQYLPRRLLIKTIIWLNKWWVKKTSPDWSLLGVNEFRKLFPEALILKERVCGLTKSIIAIKSLSSTMINNEDNINSIICFAGCDWWYHNRGLFCPQVMKRLAKDYKVLFVNSLGMRVPSLKGDKYAAKKIFRKLHSLVHFLRKADNGMYVFSPLSLPFLGSPFGRKFNTFFLLFQVKLVMALMRFKKPIFYVGCVPAFEIVKKLNRRYLIYERTDLFEEMPGTDKNYIASLDRELAESADLVLYVNKAMWKQGVAKNENSILLGHGVDFEVFSQAEKSNHVPDDIALVHKPIVGFFGEITADVCDFALLEYMAKELPNISLVLIGTTSSDVSGLRVYNNVYFLGHKPYEQIPDYGKVFDVAIMPWKRNKWIEFCNPVKIKEYLALGRPVVSIYYPEIEPYSDIVYVAKSYEQFVSYVRKAIAENDVGLKIARRKRVENETWDSKVKQIIHYIENGVHE
jgi:hypothetical protein